MAARKSILSSRVSKWMGHTIAQSSCLEATARHIPDIPGWGFVFQQDCALVLRARDIERCPTSFLQHCGRRIHPICTHSWQSSIASRVHCRRKLTDSELLASTNFKRVWSTRGHALIVDAAIGHWRRRLNACVQGAEHTLSAKHKVQAILSSIYQKFLNVYGNMTSHEVRTNAFHSFSWETIKFSTFMFNKVVRRFEWGEVENVYKIIRQVCKKAYPINTWVKCISYIYSPTWLQCMPILVQVRWGLY